MEHTQHMQLSQQPLDDAPSRLSRAREVLSHTAGNSQHLKQSLTSIGIHDDIKSSQPRMDPPKFTVPSQPSRRSLANTLELRRTNTRRHRGVRFVRNPIENSPQYIAYRGRQQRANAKDQKWPDHLEDAFLNALLWMPKMGRRKYILHGRLHGRNELIAEYLWLAYLQGLPPGHATDPTMLRCRKQISSHKQVLKKFMDDHPDRDRLFETDEEKRNQKNTIQVSFKNDPCLLALSRGRVYTGPNSHSSMRAQSDERSHIKPAVFWLLITSESVPDDASGRYTNKEELYRIGVVAHEYTGLGSQRSPDNLNSIANWRERFPLLEQISHRDKNCEIIHMNVSLHLMRSYAQRGAELVTRMELSIPGRELSGHQWQTVTTLVKPNELYHEDRRCDPPMQHKNFHAEVVQVTDDETRVKVPFPANAWAHAFTCLTNIQQAFEESKKLQSAEGGVIHDSIRPARDFVEQISMYQEVHSSPGQGQQFVRRAIILWTFQKARNGENGSATWRNLDPHPPRRTCMSPSPDISHNISATWNENFNSWADSPLQLQTQDMMDPFVQGLATPPTTAGLHSSFSQDYSYPNQHFDMPPENVSFVSNTTLDSEDTLIGHEAPATMDTFLSHPNVNLNIILDHNSANSWHMPHTESFEADSVWASYNVPASTPQMVWDTSEKHTWPGNNSPQKHVPWIDESTKNEEHWSHALPSPAKQDQHYTQGTIEQKLLPWVDHHQVSEGTKNNFTNTNNVPLADHDNAHMENAAGETKENEEHWDGAVGGFEYEHLTQTLK